MRLKPVDQRRSADNCLPLKAEGVFSAIGLEDQRDILAGEHGEKLWLMIGMGLPPCPSASM